MGAGRRPYPPLSSDVCKHCTEAACLDVCPTGALFRTEFGTVVVQDDVCNGCGYCVPACPFGVIARREEDGQAHKCTLCYDRLGAGLEPTYTAALICDTAVPAWHAGYREMPYVFAGSAASAAGGLGLLATAPADAEPARNLAVFGAAVELIAKRQLIRRLAASREPASPEPGSPEPVSVGPASVGPSLAEPYEAGTTGAVLRLAEFLTAGALAGAVLGRRSRVVSALAGASLVAASAMTRFGIFEAGMASARDPKYTIVPQRRRRGVTGAE